MIYYMSPWIQPCLKLEPGLFIYMSPQILYAYMIFELGF